MTVEIMLFGDRRGIELFMKKNNKKRVMFICSVGGHLTQMLQIKKIFGEYNYVLVTEKTEVTKDMKDKYNMEYLTYCSRQFWKTYLFKEIWNLMKSFFLFIKYRPRVIVTTGTHTAIPMCYIARLFGSKVIFIESFAKRTSPTKSGKLVYPVATTFVVQWESLKEFYPEAEVWGWIY